ncbi:MAG: carbohydrate kinase [Solibacillus sp.]
MKKRILCIGELLIDFFTIERGVSIQQATHFEKQAGGAPANVCAAIAKLGGQASFCGKVGTDAFGHFLEQTLEQASVNTELLIKDARYPTTLAFVSRQQDGERDFIFNRGADAELVAEELPMNKLLVHEVVHFGSATALLSDPFTRAYRHLFAQFEQCGAFLSFDPNYREQLWNGDIQRFVRECTPFLRAAHFVKMSEEELALFSAAATLEQRAKEVYQLGMKWLVITLGARGTLFYDGGEMTLVPSISVEMVDSTGAGDAFVGAILVQLSELEQPLLLEHEQLVPMIARANKVGAKVCEKVGAIAALPTWQDMD